MFNTVKNFLIESCIFFEENKDLKKITWIKRGGKATIFIQPQTIHEFEQLLTFLSINQIKYDLFGGTSNLLCKETYNPAILISTLKINSFSFEDKFIDCDCGVQTSFLAKKCCEMGFSGFEGLVNLPGTVGGAICNNASAFNCAISDNLYSVTFLDDSGKKREIKKEFFKFGHRTSILKEKKLSGPTLPCRFIKKKTDIDLQAQAKKNTALRKQTQQSPLLNLGSIFTVNSIRRLNKHDFSNTFKYFEYLCFMFWYKYFGNKRNLYRVYKNFILNITNYGYLTPYVSDKNINCFIWTDDNADAKFDDYCNFMRKYNKSKQLEIEVRE